MKSEKIISIARPYFYRVLRYLQDSLKQKFHYYTLNYYISFLGLLAQELILGP